MYYRINHLAVWVLVLIQQLTGYIWYSPVIFGDIWRSLLGRAEAGAPGMAAYISAIAASAAMTYFMAWLYQRMNLKSVGAALIVSMMVWASFGFLVPATFDLFRGLPFAVTVIDSGKTCLDLLLTALVLGFWKRPLHYGRQPKKMKRNR